MARTTEIAAHWPTAYNGGSFLIKHTLCLAKYRSVIDPEKIHFRLAGVRTVQSMLGDLNVSL
jgi:hypothetical protein